MAKRGRPAKPKGETIKNPVGRPYAKQSERTQLRTRRIWGAWIMSGHFGKHLPHKAKIEAIADIIYTSQATIKNSVTELNKNLDSGIWSAMYNWELKLVVIVMYDNKTILNIDLEGDEFNANCLA